MENRDKPAYPVTLDWCIVEKKVYTTTEKQGLTKREMFAMAAMQGMIAGSFGNNIKGLPEGQEFIAKWSLSYADELLKQLESKPL